MMEEYRDKEGELDALVEQELGAEDEDDESGSGSSDDSDSEETC